MKVKIKFIDGGKLPEYKTEGAACADCFCNLAADSISLPPRSTALIPLGFALEIPEGYEVVIEPRSSFAHKDKGLVVHGEIDYDYRGQLMANVYNMDSSNDLTIENHQRICQIKLQPVWRMEFEEVSELSETERGDGGFGHTGRM
jgi:dUTP pyrophosphatase